MDIVASFDHNIISYERGASCIRINAILIHKERLIASELARCGRLVSRLDPPKKRFRDSRMAWIIVANSTIASCPEILS